jgi:hypothetical protein
MKLMDIRRRKGKLQKNTSYIHGHAIFIYLLNDVYTYIKHISLYIFKEYISMIKL